MLREAEAQNKIVEFCSLCTGLGFNFHYLDIMFIKLYSLTRLTLPLFSSTSPGHRFEDVPGVRRHLVRKSTKGQVVHTGKDHKEPTTRSRKQDRTPHEVRHYRTCMSSIKECVLLLFKSYLRGLIDSQ